ncbi:hypothetical protein [Branchiibius sp. NY16-3462-2]|uniref:Asp23/Gls24 family envelope stress response protein n=1 Tax=Branchiibius cervicis TaxID=908252 RepID=A0ABW2AUB8_9MICO|nr:hypothetical protein [Branchiibius sp. NY16-3462-2]KYH45401.1 hypothetical protein AZH51_16165 [Branchiibius sp. NY16-3462-2]
MTLNSNHVSSEGVGGGSARPELVDAIAQAVLATPGVQGLHSGRFGEVATYLPGRRVAGVRTAESGSDIHIVVAWGHPVPATADAVRAAVQRVAPGRIDVTVEDVAAPDESLR